MRLIPRELPDNTLMVLMAALQAMVYDIHAPQDNLSADQWLEACATCDVVTDEINHRISNSGEKYEKR